MPSYTTEAICLKTYDYSESSKILNFYSPEQGLIRAIAKGVKRPKSKLAGACELLNCSEIQLIVKNNLDVLCQYQSMESFHDIRLDLEKLAFAMLFAELVNILAAEHDGDCEAIYFLLKGTLRVLEGKATELPEINEDTLEKTLGTSFLLALAVDFHLRLLDIAGYAPVIERCMVSDETLDWTRPYYAFSAELGGVVLAPLEAGESGERVNVSTSTLRVLNDPFGEAWAEANPMKVLKFLKYYFSYKLERRIKAYDFVFQLL